MKTVSLEQAIDIFSGAAADVLGRLRAAEAERERLAAECASLREIVANLELRLTAATIEQKPSPSQTPPTIALNDNGLTIAETARCILKAIGYPTSCTEIARVAIAAGIRWTNVDRARSQLSAVIAKELRRKSPRFRQIARGEIGLIEWTGA